METPDDKEKFKAPPRRFWPDPPASHPTDDDEALEDERRWKACPMFE